MNRMMDSLHDWALLPNAPWVLTAPKQDAHTLIARLRAADEIRTCVLDGAAMKTLDGFYDEIARVLNFPEYFGRNLDALYDCLTEDAVIGETPIVLVLDNADVVLSRATPEAFQGVLDALSDACAKLSTPIDIGERWDRPAVPFHAVFLLSDGSRPELAALPSLVR